MDEWGVLRWTVGFPEPRDPKFDLDDFKYLVCRHQLVDHLSRRIEESSPHWLPDSLRDWLDIERKFREDRFASQMAAVEDFSQALVAASLPPPIAIKGLAATFISTGAPRRWGSDADLLLPAGEDGQLDILRQLGFSTNTYDEDSVPYEAGEFMRGQAELDLHRFYPIMSYPSISGVDALLPQLNPGKWRLGASLTSTRLEYADIDASARWVVTDSGVQIRVPDPILAVIISCAHIFNGYLETGLPARFGTFSLGELAGIPALIDTPDFSRDLLISQAIQYQALDALYFVGGMLRVLLDDPGLGDILAGSDARRREPDRFARDIWWDGFLVQVQTDPTDLVFRRPSMTELVQELVPSRVAVSGSLEVLVSPERFLFQSRGPAVPEVRIGATTAPDGRLGITIALAGVPALDTEIVLINLGDHAFEVVWQAADGTLELVDYCRDSYELPPVEYSRRHTGAETIFTVTLPAVGSGSLLVGARRHDDRDALAETSVLVPLIVEPRIQ